MNCSCALCCSCVLVNCSRLPVLQYICLFYGCSCVLLFLAVSGCALAVLYYALAAPQFCVLASSRLASFSWLTAGCLLEWACGQGDGCGSRRSHSSSVPLSRADPAAAAVLTWEWSLQLQGHRGEYSVLTNDFTFVQILAYWSELKLFFFVIHSFFIILL